MNITTYQSQKAWPEKRWLAHMDMGGGTYMSFFGKTWAVCFVETKGLYHN